MLYGSGAEQLTLWPAASHASHTPSQAHARGERTSGTCGPSSHGWCASFDPDGCWLRTSLASALQQRTRCSLIWTRRATPAGRSWWVLTTLGRPTVARGCGLSPGSDWPTATANESETRTNRGGSNGRVGPEGPMLAGAVQLWPTATAQDCVGSGSAGYSTESGRHPGTTLTDAALGLWARPQARDWRQDGECPSQHRRKSPNIHAQAIRLSCEAGPPDPESSSGSGRPRAWPTPNRMDGEIERSPEDEDRRATEKAAQGINLQRVLHAAAQRASGRGSLNPAWVAQLMGVPDGWLDGCDVPSSKPSETESSPRSSRKSAAPSSRRKRA